MPSLSTVALRPFISLQHRSKRLRPVVALTCLLCGLPSILLCLWGFAALITMALRSVPESSEVTIYRPMARISFDTVLLIHSNNPQAGRPFFRPFLYCGSVVAF